MSKRTRKISTETTRKRTLPRGAVNVLSSLEENVLRMRYGITQTESEPLASKATTPELQEMLYAIEARAYEMTGRAEEGRKKAPSPKQKIIGVLKAKS